MHLIESKFDSSMNLIDLLIHINTARYKSVFDYMLIDGTKLYGTKVCSQGNQIPHEVLTALVTRAYRL